MSAITPVDDDDGWLLAADRGVAYLSSRGSVRRLAQFVPDDARTNDAACGPQGRFWVGTKAPDNHVGGGALYRLDREGQIE